MYNCIYIERIFTLTHKTYTQTGYTQTFKKKNLLKHTFIFAIPWDKGSHAPRTKYRIAQHRILSEEVLNICV